MRQARAVLVVLAVALGAASTLRAQGQRGAATAPPTRPPQPGKALQRAPDNQPNLVRVIVLNYDPLVPSEGNRLLSDVFRWNRPEELARRYQQALEADAGGAVRFEVVAWRNLN